MDWEPHFKRDVPSPFHVHGVRRVKGLCYCLQILWKRSPSKNLESKERLWHRCWPSVTLPLHHNFQLLPIKTNRAKCMGMLAGVPHTGKPQASLYPPALASCYSSLSTLPDLSLDPIKIQCLPSAFARQGSDLIHWACTVLLQSFTIATEYRNCPHYCRCTWPGSLYHGRLPHILNSFTACSLSAEI